MHIGQGSPRGPSHYQGSGTVARERSTRRSPRARPARRLRSGRKTSMPPFSSVRTPPLIDAVHSCRPEASRDVSQPMCCESSDGCAVNRESTTFSCPSNRPPVLSSPNRPGERHRHGATVGCSDFKIFCVTHSCYSIASSLPMGVLIPCAPEGELSHELPLWICALLIGIVTGRSHAFFTPARHCPLSSRPQPTVPTL